MDRWWIHGVARHCLNPVKPPCLLIKQVDVGPSKSAFSFLWAYLLPNVLSRVPVIFNQLISFTWVLLLSRPACKHLSFPPSCHIISSSGILTILLMYLSEPLVHRHSADTIFWNICLTGVVWPLVPLAYIGEKGVNDMYFSPSIIINRERSAPAQPHGTATTAVNSQSCSKPYK